MMNFQFNAAIVKMNQMIPLAVKTIIHALNIENNQKVLQVAHTLYEDARRDEWDMLFSNPNNSNMSFQEWCKKPPACIFQWGIDDNYQIYTPNSGDTGALNRVYFSNNNKVIKITQDKSEASVIALIVESGNLPGVTAQDIAELMTFSNEISVDQALYAIKQRFVNTNINQKLKNAANTISSYINQYAPYAIAREPDKFVKKISLLNIDADSQKYIELIFDVVFAVLDKTGHLWTDIHPGNIGQNDTGTPEIFDLGVLYKAKVPPTIPEIIKI